MLLAIYGAHGMAREVYVIAKKINAFENRWNEVAFIDDINDIGEIYGRKVYKLTDLLESRHVDAMEAVVAVGEPLLRERLFANLTRNHVRMTNIIHPGVYVDETVALGDGVVICEGVTITCDVKIGDNTYIQPHAVIGHDIEIGRHTVIGSNCQIGGVDRIGDRVFMGFLSGTTDRISVGHDAVISAGAMVFRDLPPSVIAVGNPARIMKKNTDGKIFKQED